MLHFFSKFYADFTFFFRWAAITIRQMISRVLYSMPPFCAPTTNHPLAACTIIIPKICCKINQIQIRRTKCPDAKTRPPVISIIVINQAKSAPAGKPLLSKNSPKSSTVESDTLAIPWATIINPMATLKNELACGAEIKGNLVT